MFAPIALHQPDQPEGEQPAQLGSTLGGGQLGGLQWVGAFHPVFRQRKFDQSDGMGATNKNKLFQLVVANLSGASKSFIVSRHLAFLFREHFQALTMPEKRITVGIGSSVGTSRRPLADPKT